MHDLNSKKVEFSETEEKHKHRQFCRNNNKNCLIHNRKKKTAVQKLVSKVTFLDNMGSDLF